MIFNTTYTNEDYNLERDRLVGKSYSFLEKIKLKGVGSSRMIIASMSEKLQPKQQQFSEASYANIELRVNGVIVHFTNRLERFSWLIPYYRLVIYSTSFFTIHANGNFIQFTKNKNYRNNRKFLDKMIQIKNESLNLEYYDG